MRWVRNIGPGVEPENVKCELASGEKLVVGEPRGNKTWSAAKMKSVGIRGVYVIRRDQ